MDFQVSEKCVVPEEWKAGIGHDFRHYKGKMYRLLGLAPHSETLESMAVYQLLYGDFGLWVRPAKMFFEEIEIDGRRIRRFEEMERSGGLTNSLQTFDSAMTIASKGNGLIPAVGRQWGRATQGKD